MSEDRQVWEEYVERVCVALGVEAAQVPIDEVLDLARVVAHNGIRPMAPVSAYILALAASAYPEQSPAALRRTLEEAAGFSGTADQVD